MNPQTPMLLLATSLFGATALGCLVVLVLAILKGRVGPTRTWAWVVGLVLAVLGTAGHLLLAAAILVSGSGGSWWLLLGSTALVSATVLAFIRPRWAAWMFAVTAVVIPALLAVGEAVVGPDSSQVFPAAAVAGFYSVRALLTALFLWIGTLPVRGSRPPASPSPELRSESVPIG